MCDPHALDSCAHDRLAILTRICPRGGAYRSPHTHRSKARTHHSLVASFPFSTMQIGVEKKICCVLCADLSSFFSPIDFQLPRLHNLPPHASSLVLCSLASLSCVSKVCHCLRRSLARCTRLKNPKTQLTR